MKWISFRVLLAHLGPGFIPALLFFSIKKEDFALDALGGGADLITVFILSSVGLGIAIDHIRLRLEPVFIEWANLSWFSYWLSKLWGRITGQKLGRAPLKKTYARYDRIQEEMIRTYIQYKMKYHPELERKISTNSILSKASEGRIVSSGDWWALLSVREESTLSFYAEQYFSYYEFASNMSVSLLLTEGIAVYFWFSAQISANGIQWITGAIAIFILVLYQLSVHWLLASKRFVSLAIFFSLLQDDEE